MKTAFQVDIKSIRIASPTGRSFDATYIFTQFVLHESIYSTAMSGNVTINDDFDHYELLPIVGQELLTLEVETLEDIYTFDFIVYKVSDIRKISGRRSEYTLHFVSPEQYLNENKRLSRSYANTSTDKVIKDIMSSEIGTSKNVIVEETEGQSTYVAPNVRPFTTIRQLMRRSVSSETGNSNFVFYEDRRGYIIATLNALMGQDTKYTYGFKENYNSEDDSTAQHTDFFGIEQLEMKKQTDTLDALSNGMFASQLHSIDLIQRKTNIYDYDYFTEFDSTSHLNEYPLYSKLEELDKEGNQYFSYTNETALDNEYVNEYQPDMHIELTSQTRLKRRIQLQMLNSYVINMTVPGNVLLFVGDVIEISAKSNQTKVPNSMISGRSIVTGITHLITASNRVYKQRIETVKDSLAVEIGKVIE